MIINYLRITTKHKLNYFTQKRRGGSNRADVRQRNNIPLYKKGTPQYNDEKTFETRSKRAIRLSLSAIHPPKV
jgi:hypothetical protein